MFDIVIPTIWSPSIDFIDNNLKLLSDCKLVNKIILINNKPEIHKDRYIDNTKIEEMCFDNIYVNASWNIGVKNSTSDYVCILNDDLSFNPNVFYFLENSFRNIEDMKIIGICKSSFNLQTDSNYSLEKISVRNRGWGCLIFVKRNEYTYIPQDLRIHFGDDYLIKRLEGFVWKLSGMKVISEISTSINSDEKFLEIIQQDNINSLKYGLPWSSDF